MASGLLTKSNLDGACWRRALPAGGLSRLVRRRRTPCRGLRTLTNQHPRPFLILLRNSRLPPAADDTNTTIRVNVKLVNVFATVTTAGGAPVSTLKQEDFQIFEDGKPQKIAVFQRESELPLSIVIAIDTSLSTRNSQKLELDSARRFAHAILRPIDGISLFQFSEIVDQLTPFTLDISVIDKGISRVHTGAATALYDTLYLAPTRCWTGADAK